MDEATILSRFEKAGQSQVFRFFPDLDDDRKQHLLAQANSIDLDEIDELIANHLRDGDPARHPSFEQLAPAPYIPLPENGGDTAAWEAAEKTGAEALRAGRVAAFTVAGGQGTRLGYDGPKGTFPVTPVRKKMLFRVFAEKILAAQAAFECRIPWFIMTSQINDQATRECFESNHYFGLDPEQVVLFTQGLMPAVDSGGKILLSAPHEIAMSPDGHGGSLRALVRSGAIETMKRAGIDIISYFQVDNPLVQAIDPAFIGFHLRNQSEMSSKMVPKEYPEEKVGVFCEQDGNTIVVEYSDLPEELMKATDPEGNLRFAAGSIAIHILSRDFVEKVGGGEHAAYRLPFHRAHKKIGTVSDSGQPVEPSEPNGYKFEMFVFDALPFAENPTTLECRREDEFAPVKNARGKDSPQTCSEAQLRQAARWFRAAGDDNLEILENGLPAIRLEISPLFATNEQAFVTKWNAMQPRPPLVDGLVLE